MSWLETIPAVFFVLVGGCATPPASGPPKPPAPSPRAQESALVHASATVEVGGGAGDTAPWVRGEVVWTVDVGTAQTVAVAAPRCDIHSIEARPRAAADASWTPVEWTQTVVGGVEGIEVSLATRTSERAEVRIRYTAAPSEGLSVAKGEDGEPTAYWATFHTWQWLPAPVAPSRRATLALSVKAAEWDDAVVLATGDGDGPGPDIAGEVPHPSYLWGFVVARDGALVRRADPKQPNLVLWAPDTSHPGLEQASRRTAAALDRWTEAGFAWPPGSDPYIQVFVPGRAAQELAGMAFIGAGYLDELAEDPEEDWLLVHEAAHQLWGNRVTCATWGDFWVNEAVVVWWVARDKHIRGDGAGAARERRLWTKRLAAAVSDGDDPRVARPGATVDVAGGSVVYNGGALVLDAIAERLGGADALTARLAAVGDASLDAGHTSLSTDAFVARLGLGSADEAAIRALLAGRRQPR